MKTVTSLLLGLAMLGAALTISSTKAEEGKKEKTVTLKGEIHCTKCSLGETRTCGHAIKVKQEAKDVLYYILDKGAKEPYHGKVCTSPANGMVIGVVSTKDKKQYITPAKDGVKID